MVNLIKIKDGRTVITQYESEDEIRSLILNSAVGIEMSIDLPNYQLIKFKKTDEIWITVMGSHVELVTRVPGGKLVADTVGSPYAGIDIEYIDDDENEDTDALTRPRVLIEKPYDTYQLAAMVWGDKNNEDYSHKITFEEND